MDARAAIPVTLPRENPTQSYWQDPPDEIADLRSTEALPNAADVVIIGSGITGAAVAWNLLQAGTPPGGIVMLEARQACSGATGRNGGHTKAASYRSFLDHASTLGLPVACQIAHLELANINAVHAFAAEHSIPCDSNPCGTVDAIYDPAQWARAQEAVAAMRDSLGADDAAARYTFHSAEEMRDRFLCKGEEGDGLCGGVSYAAGSLSGYKLGVGVLKLCLEKGLNLQTNTPATGLSKGDDGLWRVETPRGSVRASKAVLATNGYTAYLWKRFQGSIVPLRGQITAHRPGANMPGPGLPTTYSFIYEKGYEYMIPRPPGSKFAGDIVIGGGLARAPDEGLTEYGTTDDATTNPAVGAYLRETTPRYFGASWGADDPAGRIRKEWTGIMGYSPDGLPFVGELPGEEGLWMSCSFQGHGMVLCWMCARALVEMMDGRDGPALDEWFPAAFRVGEERLRKRFVGRLHTAAPVESPASAARA